MERFEKVSFIIPFDDTSESMSPTNNFSLIAFPHDLTLNTRIGFVGLLPHHRYSLKLYISPIRIYIKKGEQAELSNPLMEITSVDINTKVATFGGDIAGQVTIKTESLTIGAKGIYQIKGDLLDSDAGDTLLHTNYSFFSVG